MGIDVFLCARGDGGHWVADDEGEDQYASLDGLVNMTRMFGLVLEKVRQFEDDTIEDALREFDRYVGEDRSQYMARFHDYFQRARRAAQRAEAEDGGVEAHLEEIDPDAQVFFGRLLLTRRMVEPEEAGIVATICGLACGCFKMFMLHYREVNPGLSESLARAFTTLKDLCYFCDQALMQRRPLYVLA